MLARDVVIALRERALNLDCTLHRFESAVELEQESVADRFRLEAVEARQNLTQYSAMFFQQFEREGFVALRHRAVADHVREQDGGEFALLGVGAHRSVNPILRIKAAKRGSLRRLFDSGSKRNHASESERS